MAGRSFRLGRSNAVSTWLALTVLLGGAFITGQAVEYRGLLERGVTLSTNLFGTTFFTLTGFHGLHVLVGLCALGTLLGAARSNAFWGMLSLPGRLGSECSRYGMRPYCSTPR